MWHRSREQVDFVRAAVSKESRSLCQVIDALRKEAHQPGASEIRCHGIISQNDGVQASMASVKRPIAFHGDDSIGDDEVRPNRGADVENASLDALPMENVFWPPVDGARSVQKLDLFDSAAFCSDCPSLVKVRWALAEVHVPTMVSNVLCAWERLCAIDIISVLTHSRASRQSYQQLKNHHIQACLVIRHGQVLWRTFTRESYTTGPSWKIMHLE